MSAEDSTPAEAVSASEELSSDLALLNDTDAVNHPAFAAFKATMKGRAYGGEALDSAWAWFRSGHDAGTERAARIVSNFPMRGTPDAVRRVCMALATVVRAAVPR